MSTVSKAGGTASLVHMLHRASQIAEELFVESAGSGEPTPRQLIVLEIVAEEGKPSQTTICDRTGIDRSTVADIVRRLVAKGLLQRRRTREDARRYAVSLTEEGRRALKRSLPWLQEVDRKLLGSQPASQRADLSTALQRILEVANRKAGR